MCACIQCRTHTSSLKVLQQSFVCIISGVIRTVYKTNNVNTYRTRNTYQWLLCFMFTSIKWQKVTLLMQIDMQSPNSVFVLRSEWSEDSYSTFIQRRDMNKGITFTASAVCVLVPVPACMLQSVCVCVFTSNPCLRTLKVDLGPRPQATYSWGVSSLAKSAIFKKAGRKQTSQ